MSHSESVDITINHKALSKLRGATAPLYREIGGTVGRAVLLLSEDGILSYEVYSPYEGVPFEQAHRRTLSWDLPATLTGDDLYAALSDIETLTLLQCCYEGHSVVWDGHNYVGRLDEDAEEAYDEIASVIYDLEDDGEPAEVWDMEEYLCGTSIEDLWPADLSIDDAVNAIEKEAEERNVHLTGDEDLAKFLCRMLLEVYEQGRIETISEHQRQAIAACRLTDELAEIEAELSCED